MMKRDEFGIPVSECHSAEQFIANLNEIHSRWRDGTWIYRGQNDASWALRPKAMRKDISIILESVELHRPYFKLENLEQKLRDKWKETEPNDYQRFLTLSLHCVLERRIVEAFIEIADQAGLAMANDSPQLPGLLVWDGEQSTIHDQVTSDFHSTYPSIDVDPIKYALAQHHGLPTRLLDWTYRPLVAAFFAAFTERVLKPVPERMVVWVVKRKCLDDTDCQLLAHRRGEIGFFQAQDGVFLYDKQANREYRDTGMWRPLDRVLSKLASENGVWKLTLPFSQRDALLELLARKRVSKSFLMPSFDVVAEDILEGRVDWIKLLEG